MAQHLSNDANSSGSRDEATDMMEVLRGMIVMQQHQMKLLKDGLLIVQQTTATALNRATVPQEPRIGNVSDFRRLHSSVFTSTRKPLEAEQWLIDTTNLLNATRILAEDVTVPDFFFFFKP